MSTIRRLRGSFVSCYVKPSLVERTVEQLIPASKTRKQVKQPVRRELERRCGRDRRQQQQAVLLDLRSPHARRKTSRRTFGEQSGIEGIDTFA
ncbi:MAG: hypothetical protein PVF28_04725 [Thioalkalispiraceae bacterium]|jgi:hypothetical protein